MWLFYLVKLLLMMTMRYDFSIWRVIHNERFILLFIVIFFFDLYSRYSLDNVKYLTEKVVVMSGAV